MDAFVFAVDRHDRLLMSETPRHHRRAAFKAVHAWSKLRQAAAEEASARREATYAALRHSAMEKSPLTMMPPADVAMDSVEWALHVVKNMQALVDTFPCPGNCLQEVASLLPFLVSHDALRPPSSDLVLAGVHTAEFLMLAMPTYCDDAAVNLVLAGIVDIVRRHRSFAVLARALHLLLGPSLIPRLPSFLEANPRFVLALEARVWQAVAAASSPTPKEWTTVASDFVRLSLVADATGSTAFAFLVQFASGAHGHVYMPVALEVVQELVLSDATLILACCKTGVPQLCFRLMMCVTDGDTCVHAARVLLAVLRCTEDAQDKACWQEPLLGAVVQLAPHLLVLAPLRTQVVRLLAECCTSADLLPPTTLPALCALTSVLATELDGMAEAAADAAVLLAWFFRAAGGAAQELCAQSTRVVTVLLTAFIARCRGWGGLYDPHPAATLDALLDVVRVLQSASWFDPSPCHEQWDQAQALIAHISGGVTF